MGLSRSGCDFDPSDFDRWWEMGRTHIPPAGRRCIECNAPLPQEPCGCIIHHEVSGFDGEEPTQADDEDDDAFDERLEKFQTDNGWNWDAERYERVSGRDYRCGRCSGLAESYEEEGYDFIAPGDLIECNIQYAEDHGGKRLKWVADASGVLNPRPWSIFDHVALRVRRARFETGYFIRYGWRWQLLRLRHRIKSLFVRAAR